MSEALEESTTQLFQTTALEDVQKDFPNHFDAVNQHPRLLVGKEVPSINGEGMETLRSSEDAKDWQEAMKTLLVREVQDRAQRAAEEDRGTLSTIHASIDLFQNNPDLVPGTRQFDKVLADRLMAIAGPYAERQDGKLIGFKIPLQPLIEQIRGTLKEERAKPPEPPPAAAPAAPAPAKKAAAPAAPVPAAPAAAPVAQPQAGIPSQAGQSSEAEDFSTLFGTIGLPNFRI